jgi:cytochrome b561
LRHRVIRFCESHVTSSPNTDKTYHRTAIGLHWLVAALVLVVWALGAVLEAIDDPAIGRQVLGLHRSVGLVIFALTALRLVLRLIVPAPAPLPGPSWQQWSARAVHGLLYALMVALPITGYLATVYRGREVVVFGLISLPMFVEPDRALSHSIEEVHGTAMIVVPLLVGVHVAAALYHQWIIRDGILARMGLGQFPPTT